MGAALLPALNGTCINNIAADMADVMLSISAKLMPRSKRPRGPWCADKYERRTAQRLEARRSLRANPNNSILRMAAKNLGKFLKAAVLSFLWAHVPKLKARAQEGDRAVFMSTRRR